MDIKEIIERADAQQLREIKKLVRARTLTKRLAANTREFPGGIFQMNLI